MAKPKNMYFRADGPMIVFLTREAKAGDRKVPDQIRLIIREAMKEAKSK